jgi:hypothetical protein
MCIEDERAAHAAANAVKDARLATLERFHSQIGSLVTPEVEVLN